MSPTLFPAWALGLLLPMTGCLSIIDRDVAMVDAQRAQAELIEAKARAELREITRRAELEATP